jgi:hypothetical protein
LIIQHDGLSGQEHGLAIRHQLTALQFRTWSGLREWTSRASGMFRSAHSSMKQELLTASWMIFRDADD